MPSHSTLRPTAQPFQPSMSRQQQHQQSPGPAPAPYQATHQQPANMWAYYTPPRPQWTFRSRVAYEILRNLRYPEELSRCIAGTWSGIRSPKGFDKALWNEANANLLDKYPVWMDGGGEENKLRAFYATERNKRLADERAREKKRAAPWKQKAEEPNKPNEAEDWIEGFNAETQHQLAELDTETGAVQDAPPSPSAGPADSPSHGHVEEEEEEENVMTAAAPHAEAAEAPEMPAEEEEPADQSQQTPEHSSGAQGDNASFGELFRDMMRARC
ncbi:hypothetical protein PG997_007868 [Apiospora hydei]|uniref:HMG box domain-containing protein n=1 Tax=Apiospora hydei TaxID=1337664 RepID=A0ABR1W978_9PEZI